MSNPPHQQSRLSVQLRKRNLERSEDGLPHKKHVKQIESTEVNQQAPAFGPPLLEERKVIKRGNNVETTKTLDGAPQKKRDTRQSTLQQFLLSSSPVPESSSQETASASVVVSENTEKVVETTIQKALETETTTTPTGVSTKYSTTTLITKEDQHQQQQETTTAEGHSSPDLLNSPSPSPTVESISNPVETGPSSPHTQELASLPSPSSTPKINRIAPTSVHEKSPPSASSPTTASSSIVHGKSLLVKLDKERINEERTTLDKLVSALDITLTFHAARNVAAFFHKIQPMLRNSTKKNITISHLCQILYVAPELYDVDTKLLKEYGKDVEAHQVSIGHTWKMPLSGKMIQERKDLITKRSGDYYEQHTEANAKIPEKELPRLDKVVDKKKWLQNANLPDRVRSVLELQEKLKAAKEEKAAQPRIEPVGTAKDRAKALLERIRNKQKK
ncbi:hypothetical protein BC941DRAFT_417837 [Chlamydoabsidia padenii]|nr:hypothetical protein BC941DRAFT_417837 [Chlamydoabsidia padenii]